MLFPSVVFLAYFAPIFFCAYFFLPWRNVTFFLFSLVFFFWGETKYIGVLLAYILVNYLFGLFIGTREAPAKRRKWALIAGVSANLGMLAYFKYWIFLLQKILPDFFGIDVGSFHHPHLPLGISYFTFHGISYLADVYRGVAVRSKSPLNIGLYIAMFPHMVAGPIVRYHTIAKALVRRYWTVNRIAFGLRLFAIGLGQKVLIANNIARLADRVFALPAQSLDAPTAWLGAVAYTLQIYFDFCGYSFMAIALGIILGFRLPRNFRYPYSSQSITEFWRRWHISLATWFRDYVYIPLGGNRKSMARTLFNLVTVFFLCGLWHGAAYTFIAWGLFHGFLLVFERLGGKRLLSLLPRPLRHAYVILAVILAWILFRADGLHHTLNIWLAIFGMNAAPEAKSVLELATNETLVALGLGLLFSVPWVEQAVNALWRKIIATFGPPGRRWVGAARALWALFLFLASSIYILAGSYSPFLYFRF